MLSPVASRAGRLVAPDHGTRSWPRRRTPEILAALAGFAWFLVLGGRRALPPTAFDWLGGGDHAQHVLGWLFFRRSHWGLPLGRIDGFAWPTGTTVGFTDSNPLVALVTKPFSPLLPLDFQYVGAWLAACFALQGWFGARIAACASERPEHRALCGGLFALSPPLFMRVGHDTLCAHFGVLALIHLHLSATDSPRVARRALWAAAALCAAFSAVHPYLAVMCITLTLALVVKLAWADRLLPRAAALRWAALAVFAPASVFAILGYFTSAPSHGPNFGAFSTDLLALVNPLRASWIVPPLPLRPGQWEGNAYLGLGGLALVVCAAALVVPVPPSWRRLRALLPLAAACALLLAFALSNVVRAGGREVLDLRRLYRPLEGVVGPFRSSGRFVWPFYYAVLACGVAVVLTRLRRWRATAVLGLAILLQVLELAPGAYASEFAERRWRPSDPAWSLARERYDHLALVPPQVVGVWGACRGLVYGDQDVWAPLAYVAYELGMTVNSGYLARGSAEVVNPPCAALDREVEEGVLRARTLYVAHASKLQAFERAGAQCGALDGFTVCVRPTPGDPFAAALAAARR